MKLAKMAAVATLAATLGVPAVTNDAEAAARCRVKDRVGEGVVIGGTAGAIIGGATTQSTGGALLGGVLGAVGGAIVGSQAVSYKCCDTRYDRYGRPYRVCWR